MLDVKKAAPACLTDACLTDVRAAVTEVTRIDRDLGSIAGAASQNHRVHQPDPRPPRSPRLHRGTARAPKAPALST